MAATAALPNRVPRTANLPGYVSHPDFKRPSARTAFAPAPLLDAASDANAKYMPDDVTREHAKRMHYSAYRTRTARTAADVAKWQAAYLELRDRIVLGNRKLIYRAVRRQMSLANRADDMIGDCHIVLIHAVAAFNPWLDIRFSTYAYTCLVRALGRASQRLLSDRLAHALSFDALPDGEPRGHGAADPRGTAADIRIDEFLRSDHPLLSDREKAIIKRRFCATDSDTNPTLENVGHALGLSKERVRQVQASALDKLRRALSSPTGA